MSSVPDERAVIDHVADEKPELKLIDWGTNFVVYPALTIDTNSFILQYNDLIYNKCNMF